MTDLILPLKGEYFDAIRDGTKPDEYRLVNPYWTRRLHDRSGKPRSFGAVILTKGYPKRDDADCRLTRVWKGFRRVTLTHPHFGAEPVEVYAINVAETEGTDEGDTCLRGGCRGVLKIEPSAERDGCACHISPPCGYCMSKVPECPDCGWRDEEPN